MAESPFITSELRESFHWFRSRGLPALASIMAARSDLANGRRRCVLAAAVSYGPATAAFGESHCRFVENIADGLRFVGFADQVAELRHTGWHLDDDGCGETVRGAVWRLPAMGGRPRFVAGYVDPANVLAAFVSFDVTDDATTAAAGGDRMAERMAAQEREYNLARQAGDEFERLAEFVGETRRSILAIIREAKEFCQSGALAIERTGAIRAVISAKIESSLKAIRQARARREELANCFSALPGWAE